MTSQLRVDRISPANTSEIIIDGFGGGGKILQVVQAVKSETWSTLSTDQVDIPNLSASITPSSVNSKILVQVDMHVGFESYSGVFHLLRDNEKIYAGDGGLNRCGLFSNSFPAISGDNSPYNILPVTANYLDNPQKDSSITYKITGAVCCLDYPTPIYVNRTAADLNEANRDGLTASSITLMEVAS